MGKGKASKLSGALNASISADDLQRATYAQHSQLDELFGAKAIQTAPSGTSIVRREDGSYVFGKFVLTPVGLASESQIGEQDYESVGRLLLEMGNRINWLIGDWVVYGMEFQWGETYQRLAEEFGIDESTIRNYAYVCRNVDLSLRNDKLLFSHHKEVAQFEPESQAALLQIAAEQNMSVRQLREYIRAQQLGSGTQEEVGSVLIDKTTEKSIKHLLTISKRFQWGDLQRLDEKSKQELAQAASELEALARKIRDSL